MPKYVVFWQKCQNILFSSKWPKYVKKIFLGKKNIFARLIDDQSMVTFYHSYLIRMRIKTTVLLRGGKKKQK